MSSSERLHVKVFGVVLHKMMNDLKVGREDLCQTSGLTKQSVSLIIANKRVPNAETVCKIVNGLRELRPDMLITSDHFFTIPYYPVQPKKKVDKKDAL